jgi:MFS family permease
MHVVNDALFAGTYPLLPLVAADLGLTYAQVGAIKTAFSGASSALQVPAGIAAERLGEQLLLALGTGWVGLGMLLVAVAPGYLALLAIMVGAGIGGNVQHPVASAVVSRLYESRQRATAIGTLNFAGDVGKVLAPLFVGLTAAAFGWRGAFASLGLLGALFALLYLLAVPEPAKVGKAAPAPGARRSDPGLVTPEPAGMASDAAGPGNSSRETTAAGSAAGREQSGQVTQSARDGAASSVGRWGITRPGLFAVLTGIGVLDSAARGAALVFIPFLLDGKGADPGAMSFYFAVLFAAGAAGKFICGPLAGWFGNVGVIAITELITAGALLGLLVAPLGWALAAILPLGFVLNGTSSVLYASVAGLVHASRRARGYGLYYTCTLLASAGAPVVYGLLADRTSLGIAFATLAGVTALIVPVTLISGRGLASADA